MSEPTDLDIGFDDLLGVVELDLTKAFDEAHTWFERQRDREMYSATGGERPDPFQIFAFVMTCIQALLVVLCLGISL